MQTGITLARVSGVPLLTVTWIDGRVRSMIENVRLIASSQDPVFS